MTAVAVSATTTAATTAGFLAGVRVVARTSGSKSGKLFIKLRRAAMRTFRAAPISGADKNFGVAFTLGAMKFVNRHN